MSLDQVAVHAQNAYALASGDTTTASRIIELTGHAIRSWRRPAGLDNPGDKATTVDNRGKVVLKTAFVPSHQRAGTKTTAGQPKTMALTGIARRSSR
jgi:hypothetical protein